MIITTYDYNDFVTIVKKHYTNIFFHYEEGNRCYIFKIWAIWLHENKIVCFEHVSEYQCKDMVLKFKEDFPKSIYELNKIIHVES